MNTGATAGTVAQLEVNTGIGHLGSFAMIEDGAGNANLTIGTGTNVDLDCHCCHESRLVAERNGVEYLCRRFNASALIPASNATFDLGSSGNNVRTVYAGDFIQKNASFLIHTAATMSNAAGAGAGTLTNAPSAGNPTKWVGWDDNGTTRYFPSWS